MQLGYVIRYVPNVEASMAFYEAAFGLSRRFLHESGAYGEMETGATALGFASEENAPEFGFAISHQRPDGLPGPQEIAFVIADVADAYRRALAAGAVSLMPPTEKPWGQTVAYVRDSDGALVELCTPVSGG
ncbi:VOC family protein [Lacibacterium aquatile]|uniref:VOC family protein n=1 Tax=Lacibacterium aquatile TaxID=1168082 RepID=A0ABW5DMI5_9PROT